MCGRARETVRRFRRFPLAEDSMPKNPGLLMSAAAMVGAVFLLLGLFVFADRSGTTDAPLTEQVKP
jgi:hypothetical protein